MENDHHFEVRQDGMTVAEVSTTDRESGLREARHYAMMYGQDGPVEIYEVRRTKLGEPVNVVP